MKFKRQSEDSLQTALVLARTHWAGLTYKQQLGAVAALNFLAGIFFTNAIGGSCPVCVSPIVTSAGGGIRRNNVAVTNQFERIFQKVYEDATLNTKKPKRKQFDIKWWEKKSKLTTEGGLQREDRILLSELYSNAESVFEYGLGESTYMANYLGVPRYAGTDSDAAWVESARNKVAKHYRFYFADIGKTGKWGLPQDVTLAKNILNYQLEPLAVEREPFDVYMVDGRYRLACALASFLHASARGGDPSKTTVLIHDCLKEEGNDKKLFKKMSWEGREVYHKGHVILDMVNHSGNRLCVYKRKPDTTDEQIANMYMEFSTNII